MRTYDKLRKSALEACKFRGHTMTKFYKNRGGHSKCKHCGMTVTILVNPMPNEIDIGGNAVALHCTKQ